MWMIVKVLVVHMTLMSMMGQGLILVLSPELRCGGGVLAPRLGLDSLARVIYTRKLCIHVKNYRR